MRAGGLRAESEFSVNQDGSGQQLWPMWSNNKTPYTCITENCVSVRGLGAEGKGQVGAGVEHGDKVGGKLSGKAGTFEKTITILHFY